jgi:hypothetical protein
VEDEQVPPVQAPPAGQDNYPRPGYGHQPTALERIVPASNPNALIGYYIGLFSIMPVLGLAMGPAGIVLGLKGLKAVKQSPGLPGTGHAITAIIGGIIGSLINYGIGIILLMVFLDKPAR